MSEFDKDFKIGDIIIAYHKGYHRVTQIEQRFITAEDNRYGNRGAVGQEYSAIIHYVQVARADGEKVKTKKVKQCDAAWCHLASDTIKKLITNLTQLAQELGL